jgi:hypothetical protein
MLLLQHRSPNIQDAKDFLFCNHRKKDICKLRSYFVKLLLIRIMLVTITIGKTGHMPATCTRFSHAQALNGFFLTAWSIGGKRLPANHLWIAYFTWTEAEFNNSCNGHLLRNIIYHSTASQMIFLPRWCFVEFLTECIIGIQKEAAY